MNMAFNTQRITLVAALALSACLGGLGAASDDADRIRPWTENPQYWQFKGQPVMLLGGSDQDNLFNHPNIGPDGLEAHLDLLVSVGGNYLRNTMSSRDRVDPARDLYNDDSLYAFHRDETTGLFDLDRWDERFWERFRNFLEMTAKRDIIVQIEIWDRWDHGQVWGGGSPESPVAVAWSGHPFNPKNNINYTSEQTNLHEDKWEGYPIFRTIPELDDAPRVLAYQEAMVDKLLSISLKCSHVLYCISNESTASEEWSRHWAHFVRKKASDAGVAIELTEMWDAHDLTNPMHRRTFDHPDLYSFVDTSQNNLRDGQTHWNNMQAARKMVAVPPRPMNNVKIYGGERLGGSTTEAKHKFWRNIFGGVAASRFHRPGQRPGYFSIGLSSEAQTQIRSARTFLKSFDVFPAEPDNGLLSERGENEAYCMAAPGKQYAVYFPDGGAVKLDVSAADGPLEARWLDIERSAWQDTQTAGGGQLELEAPGPGQWAVLVQKK